jgi:hypothetical protein
MPFHIGEKAPNLSVFDWVQGKPTNLDSEIGNVVLVKVFQVNCPGYFNHEIPQVVETNSKYYQRGLKVLGIAPAIEK